MKKRDLVAATNLELWKSNDSRLEDFETNAGSGKPSSALIYRKSSRVDVIAEENNDNSNQSLTEVRKSSIMTPVPKQAPIKQPETKICCKRCVIF